MSGMLVKNVHTRDAEYEERTRIMATTAQRTYKMTVQARGQVTLPKLLRHELNLEPGDSVIAAPDGNGGFRLVPFKPMTIDEMFERWGDPTPVTFEEVERQIQKARDAYAGEIAREYAE